MSDQQIQKLLQGAVKAAKQGDKALARRAFLQVLKQDNQNESAWLGMVTVSEDRTEQARILQRLLQINPDNARAKEAARRLGFDLAPPQPEPPEDDIPEPPAPEALPDDIPEPPIQEVPEDDIPEPPAPEALPDDIPEPEMWEPLEDETQVALPEDEFVDTTPPPENQSRKRLQRLRTDELDGVSDEIMETTEAFIDLPEPPPRITLAEAFAQVPQPLPGHEGIPVPSAARVEAARVEANDRAQTALERVVPTPRDDLQWVTKNRGRAGERDYTIFLARVVGGVVGIVIAVILAGFGVAFTRPEFREVVFVPTPTASPSPTVTPTNTPGSTPTSSPTPRQSPTPTPTFPPTVTPGNPDPNFPPEPTSVYVPVGDIEQPIISQAAELMELGRYAEAFEILETEREATSASGNFVPYYWLSIWHLEQGDIEAARAIIDDGEIARAGSASTVDYTGLVNTARARIDLFEAQRLLRVGETEAASELFSAVVTQIEFVVEQVDPRITDAYLVLSERYTVLGEDARALGILSQAVASNRSAEIFTDTRLRVEIARIQLRLGNYDEALQEVNEVLYLNPFLESALTLRVEIALAKGDPGLGVLYSEAYLFYHPESVRGLQLLGDSREAEFKSDLALETYAQGLDGDSNDPAYPLILQSRAAIYARQNRLDLALADLNAALELSNARDIVRDRMLVAYRLGEFDLAQADAQNLIDTQQDLTPLVLPEATESVEPEATPELIFLMPQVRQVNPNVDRNAVLARLTLARILFDEGRSTAQAQTLLDLVIESGGLTTEEEATAYLYLAQIAQNQENTSAVLTALDQAIELQPSTQAYYLRGQFFEARGDQNNSRLDYEAALRDYDLALTLAAIQPFAFVDDLRDRFDRLPDKIEAALIESTPEATAEATEESDS